MAYKIVETTGKRKSVFLGSIKTRSSAIRKAKMFRKAYAGSGLIGRLKVIKY